MFYPLLDLIVCPNCKRFLTLLAPSEEQQQTAMRMRSSKRASPKGAAVGPFPAQTEETQLWHLLARQAASAATDGRDREVNVTRGILVCLHCERWYPIRHGLPELLPSHLRNWDEDQEWLRGLHADLASAGLSQVWDKLFSQTPSSEQAVQDEGAHYKKAEMAVAQCNLPEGFFNWGLVAPFLPSLPNFSLDLFSRFVTTGSRLGCGVNGTVLDLGIGVGWTTEWLVRLGYQAIGVDICRDYILAGIPRMGRNLPHLLVGDIENLPLCDECVEGVLSFDVFHHLPDRRRAMVELSRVMRPGAKISMVEPNLKHHQAPISRAVMKQHGILEHGFNKKGLLRYTKDTPLGKIKHYQTDIHPHNIFVVQKLGNFDPDSLTPRRLRAGLVVQPKSGMVTVGGKPELVVSITNYGDTVWLSATPDGIGEVQLGASLFDSNHTLLNEKYARVALPRRVQPGQRIRLKCALPPVWQPGNYIVELDMVIEGFLWFKNYAYHPLAWPLTVVGDASIKESYGSYVFEKPLRIVPIELSFEPNPADVVLLAEDGSALSHAAQWSGLAWRVLKSQGPFALVRKVFGYLSQRLSKEGM